ncbi:MAG: phosphoribosyltransferase family protein [Acidaminococcaceae bacterium]|nr:phosphoribosyltransferase family protein [Acidaminococcaceae bacterium]
MQMFSYHARLLKEIFFPRRCCVCGDVIDTGCFCSVCRQEFILCKEIVWGGNSATYQKMLTEARPMIAADVINRALVLYKYDGKLKWMLQKIKFDADASLLHLLAEEAQFALTRKFKYLLSSADLIICIPTSADRQARRGFDVPGEIFAFLKNVCGNKKFRCSPLSRNRRTNPLYELDAEQRRCELAGCFALSEAISVEGKNIFLCDDILTTGQTAVEAARILLEAGAASVDFIGFAAAQSNW